MPRSLLSYVTFVGSGMFKMALIFVYSGLIPSALTKWPRISISVWLKLHFSLLSFNPASAIFFIVIWRCLSCSSSSLPKNEDIVEVTDDIFFPLQDHLDCALENLGSRGDSERKSSVEIPSYRCDEGCKLGSGWVEWYLVESRCCIQFAENLRSFQSMQNVECRNYVPLPLHRQVQPVQICTDSDSSCLL